MNLYPLLKLVHIVAVIIFLGNIITGLFWMKQADKTKDLNIISFTIKGIRDSDRLFTIPGVIIILIGGFGAALHNSIPLLKTGWIFWPIVLFSISGIAFGWKLAPLQKEIYKLTATAENESFDWGVYKRKLHEWEQWGLVAMLTPAIAVAMMVLKLPKQSIF